MIEYDFLPAHLVAGEIARNVGCHYKEIEDKDRLNIDWDYYLSAGLSGSCMVVTARSESELIGYAIFLISSSSRKKHIIEAYCDGLFIEKKFRGIGPSLMREADAFLESYGVNETNYVIESDRIGRLMQKAGFQRRHTIWSKRYGQ